MTDVVTFPVGELVMAALQFNEDAPGTPLIFLHGITSSVNFWRVGQTEAVQARRWYSLSLPGHYPARFPRFLHPDVLTAEMIAETVLSAICHLVGDERFIVVGHSTGAFAALAVGACAPEQTAGIISVSGFARGYWTGALRLLQLLARGGKPGEALFHASLKLLVSSPVVYRLGLAAYAADRKALYTDPVLPLSLERLYPDAVCLDSHMMLPYFKRMPDIDITSWLPRITAPTLVITGDADPIVPPEQSRHIAHLVKNNQLVMLPGAGHLPMSERAVQYHAAITEWLGQQL